MKRLPDTELELMMIIWNADGPITRMEIEEHMDKDRKILCNSVLSFLSRLEKKGFVKREKRGKINYYSATIAKEPYLKETGRSFLKKMFQGSLANFAAALYYNEEIEQDELNELLIFLEQKDEKRG